MATTTDTLIFEMRVKDDASKVFDKWEKKLKGIEKTAHKSFSGLGGAISGAFAGVGGIVSSAMAPVFDTLDAAKDAAIDFAKSSVSAFHDYESALASVSQVTGFTGEQLDELGDSAKELAKPIGDLAATDLLAIMESAGSLGLVAGKSFKDAKETLEEFSVAVGKGSVAFKSFGGDAGKLASHVAKVENIFKLTTDQTNNLLSVMSKMRSTTAATELTVSTFMQQLVRGQSTLKLTAAEAGALAGVFANAGIEAGSAAKLLSSAAGNIAKGGSKLAGAAELITTGLDGGSAAIAKLESITGQTGTTLAQLPELIRSAFGQDALGVMQVLAQSFTETAAQTQNIEKSVAASGLAYDIFGKQSIGVIAALGEAMTDSGDKAKTWAFIYEEAMKAFENGDEHFTAYELAMQKSSTAAKLFGSAMNAVKITIGEPLANALAAIYNSLTPIVNEFSAWLDQSKLIKETLPRVLGEAQVLFADLLTTAVEFIQGVDWDNFFSRVGDGFSQIIEYVRGADLTGIFESIQGAWEDMGKSMSRLELDEVLGALSFAIDGIVFSLEVLVAGVSAFTASLDLMVRGVQKTAEILRNSKETFDNFWDVTAEQALGAGDAIKGIGNALVGVTKKTAEAAKEMYGNSFLPDTVLWAGKATSALGGINSQLVGIQSDIVGADSAFSEFGKGVMDSTNQAIKSIMQQGQQLSGIMTGISGDIRIDKQPTTLRPIDNQLPATRPTPTPQQSGIGQNTTNNSTTVVFQGQNIVDNSSQRRFVRGITKTQQAQAARTVQGSTPRSGLR